MSYDKNENKRELELYIHIPFCVKKCLYCDFLSGPADAGTIELYVSALCREIEAAGLQSGKEACGLKKGGGRRVTSIFIGGGTPSLLSGPQLLQIMDTVKRSFFVEEDAEITMEINPGAAEGDGLHLYRKAGVNRLSIGLQSAADKELRALGRIHDYNQFLDTYRLAQEEGFSNVNVDVMSALPGQSLEDCLFTLDRILRLSPPPTHISAYSLIVEKGTPFFQMQEKGLLSLPDEDTEREMYKATRRLLEASGYQRYEISNYARPGWECRHNCGYWQRKNYLGFGVGAASLMENVRFHNTTDLQTYLECFGQPEACGSGQLPGPAVQALVKCREDVTALSVEEQMEETMYLGLRMMEGVDTEAFEKAFGVSMEKAYGGVIEKNERDGLLQKTRRKEAGGRGEAYSLALTEKGIDLSNYVMAQFLWG